MSAQPAVPSTPAHPAFFHQVLWFFDPGHTDPYHQDGRCLVRYKDGRVKQAVVPPHDARIPYAMAAHGVEVRGQQLQGQEVRSSGRRVQCQCAGGQQIAVLQGRQRVECGLNPPYAAAGRMIDQTCRLLNCSLC
jgi:hypothetical protein